ncbi:MAG TPA: hypothetical protein VM689_18730 [Aliidongia sp.]|nr:hypothetical protein [Aliidongia sp.]
MIRPTTMAAFTLCGALLFGLFEVKYDVQSLEGQLAKIDRDIDADQRELHVLKGEWGMLTQGQQLAGLAQRHLAAEQLKPMAPGQLGDFDALPLRADPPAIAGADPSIESVLRAMQVSELKPETPSPSRTPSSAAAKPRLVR